MRGNHHLGCFFGKIKSAPYNLGFLRVENHQNWFSIDYCTSGQFKNAYMLLYTIYVGILFLKSMGQSKTWNIMKPFLPRCTKGSRQARKYDLVETLERAVTAGDLVCFGAVCNKSAPSAVIRSHHWSMNDMNDIHLHLHFHQLIIIIRIFFFIIITITFIFIHNLLRHHQHHHYHHPQTLNLQAVLSSNIHLGFFSLSEGQK